MLGLGSNHVIACRVTQLSADVRLAPRTWRRERIEHITRASHRRQISTRHLSTHSTITSSVYRCLTFIVIAVHCRCPCRRSLPLPLSSSSALAVPRRRCRHPRRSLPRRCTVMCPLESLCLYLGTLSRPHTRSIGHDIPKAESVVLDLNLVLWCRQSGSSGACVWTRQSVTVQADRLQGTCDGTATG